MRQLRRGPKLGAVGELAQVEAQQPLDDGYPVPERVPGRGEFPRKWMPGAVADG